MAGRQWKAAAALRGDLEEDMEDMKAAEEAGRKTKAAEAWRKAMAADGRQAR